jgi:hypothetical protein
MGSSKGDIPQYKVRKLGNSPVTVEEMQILFNFKGNGSNSFVKG